jgi:hypothetical protein
MCMLGTDGRNNGFLCRGCRHPIQATELMPKDGGDGAGGIKPVCDPQVLQQGGEKVCMCDTCASFYPAKRLSRLSDPRNVDFRAQRLALYEQAYDEVGQFCPALQAEIERKAAATKMQKKRQLPAEVAVA